MFLFHVGYLENGLPRCVHMDTSLVVQNWRKNVFPFVSVHNSCSLMFFWGVLRLCFPQDGWFSRTGALRCSLKGQVWFCVLPGSGSGFEQPSLARRVSLRFINAVVAVLETEVALQPHLPVCCRRVVSYVSSFLCHFLNSLATSSWLLFYISN